jgi:hypothetical protein
MRRSVFDVDESSSIQSIDNYKDYVPPADDTEYQSIPLDKIEDFGVHANQ